jgi:DNA-binding MarR family transcriptional regulator
MCSVLSYLLAGVIGTAVGTILGFLLKDWWDNRHEDVPEDELAVLGYLSGRRGQATPFLSDYLTDSMDLTRHRASEVTEKLTARGEIEEMEPGQDMLRPCHRITEKGETTLQERKRKRIK